MSDQESAAHIRDKMLRPDHVRGIDSLDAPPAVRIPVPQNLAELEVGNPVPSAPPAGDSQPTNQ